jgi:hypothetical protein
MTATSEAERNRRAEIMRDSRAAAVAPPRDQLTSLDRRKCPRGVIKLETIGNILVDVRFAPESTHKRAARLQVYDQLSIIPTKLLWIAWEWDEPVPVRHPHLG